MDRSSGILLHISSLPSKYGIGSLGDEAYKFVNFLKECHVKIWQILPLNITSVGNSPYQSVSSNAFNPFFIDLEYLYQDKLLTKDELDTALNEDEFVNYDFLIKTRILLLKKAYQRFNTNNNSFKKFVKEGKYDDYAAYMVLKDLNNNEPWYNWDKEYKIYKKSTIETFIKNNKYDIEFYIWLQYTFINQYNKLKEYANNLGIKIFGDLPIYLSYDSSDVWANNDLFLLDHKKNPKLVAGCPPDYFSTDGQLWGNPIYNYKKMKSNNYIWLSNRIKEQFNIYDIIRIDHFRGFEEYYAIPYGMPNAKIGKWYKGPGFDLFKDKKNLNIVAEDLGTIDDKVKLLLKKCGYPGMKVLQFAFDGNLNNSYLPSNYNQNCVCYTGTHDNTTLYQYVIDLNNFQLKTLFERLKYEALKLKIDVNLENPIEVCNTIIKLAFASISNVVIIPMQDFIYQDGSYRMNTPSTLSNKNWAYRLNLRYLNGDLKEKIKNLNLEFKRY